MAFQNKSFILGKDKTPDWFNDEASMGRARINREDGDLVNVTIFAPTQTFVASIGDTIMLLKSGLVVIHADEAKKYGVQRKTTNGEE